MEPQLEELFLQFKNYVDRLRHDLAKISERMPLERRDAFKIPDYDFETFCERWRLVANNEALRQRWMQRLSSSGYNDEHQRIQDAISRALHVTLERTSNAA